MHTEQVARASIYVRLCCLASLRARCRRAELPNMNLRLALTALAVVGAALSLPANPFSPTPVAASDGARSFNIASETYYQLDVPAGRVSARMEAEVSPGRGEMTAVTLWAMPGATNIVLKQDGATLDTTLRPADIANQRPALIEAKLAKPVRNSLRSSLLLTYDVPAQQNAFTSIEAGLVESQFVSQGPGSFVFVDMPIAGDNYVEPGCLKAADQPRSLAADGYERWVCGDALTIAFSTEDKAVQDQCARLDDRCRQRSLAAPFAGYAQSITDDARKGVLEGEVALARGSVKVSLKYFRADAEWAQQQFATAQKVLPLLEQAFGWPYPNDTVGMRQSRFIESAGAAGVAFPDQGQVLLARTGKSAFDMEVTVHELAHQWAGRSLQSNWLCEGLAEYAVKALAPAMGFTPSRQGWEQLGYSDPLATWYNGSEVASSDYWYGKAGAFWVEFEKAVGGRESMRAVLGQVDDARSRWPLDGRWFMDAGERASGANLDELFLSWVFVRDSASALVAERRAAHDLVNAFTADASASGLNGVPTDIQQLLDDWQFSSIGSLVTAARSAMDEYAGLAALAADAGLERGTSVADGWAGRSVAQSRQLIADQRQAIIAISQAAAQLAGQPEDAPSMRQLAQARARYATGDFFEAQSLASGSTTTAFNQVAAARLIEIAREKQASYNPSFLGRIGLFFRDPAADLAAAEKAYAAGDPNAALRLAKTSYDGWNGAERRGLMRLAILAGVMCLLTAVSWYVLRRLDPNRAATRPLGSGHVLTEESRSSWRDWDSTA